MFQHCDNHMYDETIRRKIEYHHITKNDHHVVIDISLRQILTTPFINVIISKRQSRSRTINKHQYILTKILTSGMSRKMTHSLIIESGNAN